MSRSLVILTLISTVCFSVQSVIAYENAYDLLERRNQKFYQPRYLHPMFYSDRRFFTQNPTPYLGYTNMDHYVSKFGNGYDNLGNGIQGHFNPFRQQVTRIWGSDRRPFRQRNFNGFYLEGHPSLRKPQLEYINHRPEVYNPIIYSYTPDRLYGDDEFNLRRKTDLTKVDRYFEDNEDKTQKKSDEFHERNQGRVKTDFLGKEKAGEQLRTNQAGENKSTLRNNKVVKKGRTTTGFAVHHHKDETGNSTTFFDETSDFGGLSDLRDTADGFDARKTLEQITHKGDEKYFTEDEEKSGSGLLKGNQRFEKDFSSLGTHEDSGRKFDGNDGLGLKKTYQYLNGDAFDSSTPHVDNYN